MCKNIFVAQKNGLNFMLKIDHHNEHLMMSMRQLTILTVCKFLTKDPNVTSFPRENSLREKGTNLTVTFFWDTQ